MKVARLLALSAVAILGASAARADKPDYPGTWTIGRGEYASRAGRPWYKGHVVTVGWDQIEPANGVFDFSILDNRVQGAAAEGLWVMTMVYTGDRAPAWLYASGVPQIVTDFQDGSSFPYYLDPDYQTFFRRMIAAVAEHVDTAYAPEVRARIIGVQCPVGASGDPVPYKNALGNWFGDGATFIDDASWEAFQHEMFQAYHDAYEDRRPLLHPLFNTNFANPLTDFAADQLRGSWLKTSRIGDRYQNNSETNPDNETPYVASRIHGFQADGRAVRARSEMDRTDEGWFTEAPLWNMYWTALWGLHNRQDMHNQVRPDVENPDFSAAFEFQSRYAGFKDARDATGAWIALRDGLDYVDTQRFPQDVYGATGTGTNQARYEAIAATMAPYGALLSAGPPYKPTNWNALNDVGWYVERGNYSMFLTQIDAAGTSQGLWRVGAPTGSGAQMYGRFARRFDHASGRDQMAFDVDDVFFAGAPLAAAYPVVVRVVYLDEGSGAWALRYDAVSDPQKTALTVTKTNTGTWREITVTLPDAQLGNRGPAGADLVLASLDAEDDTFHMIELTRATGDRQGHFGDDVPPCGNVPDPACRVPVRALAARVTLRDNAIDLRDSLAWTWAQGATTPKSDYGAPLLDTSYALCVYDAGGLRFDATIPAGGTCPVRPCWTEQRIGFTYRNPSATGDGISMLTLREGLTDGRATIRMRGKGAGLGLAALDTLASPVTVQIKSSGGGCWAATYSAPFDRQVSDQFRDRAD